MKVIYSERIGSEPALLREVNERLDAIMGASTGRVVAKWDRPNNGHSRAPYTLELSDELGSVSAEFTPSDFRSRDLRYELVTLWGDLLRIRSHKLLKRLLSGKDEPTGE